MFQVFYARAFFNVALAGIFGLGPVALHLFFGFKVPGWVLLLNTAGWTAFLLVMLRDFRLRRSLVRHLKDSVPGAGSLFFEELIPFVADTLRRQNKLLSWSDFESRLIREGDLGKTLRELAARAREVLRAESAEISLFDRELGTYDSSFVVGKPFPSGAQAMLSGAVDGEEEVKPSPEVLAEEILFAGAQFGSIRVAMPKGVLPTLSDRRTLRLISLHCGIAIINSQYSEQLLKLRQVSEESLRAKTGFLANLSHELRAPLGIMMNAVELVLNGICGPISPEQRETVELIHKNSQHLLDLINDVLDYAKIESGKLTPHPEDVSVGEVLEELRAVVRSTAEEKSHRLILHPVKKELHVHVDRRHFRQVIINLLSNAIKYTPEKGTIELWAEPKHGGRIQVNVKDNGIGISEREAEKVFRAFERVDDSYALTQTGAGLGMSLSKRLIEANAGKIQFQSEVGEGSHFWITLPRGEVPAEVEVQEEGDQPALEQQGNGEQILLVQKSGSERQMIVRYLGHVGFQAVGVQNRQEALEVLRQRKARLVIIDNGVVDHPRGDLFRKVRSDAKSAGLPVVLISSRAFVFDVERYLKEGIDRCLLKPIHLDELAVICRQLIDGSYKGAVIDTAELELAKDTQEIAALSAAKLLGIDDIVH